MIEGSATSRRSLVRIRSTSSPARVPSSGSRPGSISQIAVGVAETLLMYLKKMLEILGKGLIEKRAFGMSRAMTWVLDAASETPLGGVLR